MPNKHQLNTKLIHAGEPQKKYGGAVSMPIFQSATFEFGGQADGLVVAAVVALAFKDDGHIAVEVYLAQNSHNPFVVEPLLPAAVYLVDLGAHVGGVGGGLFHELVEVDVVVPIPGRAR